MHKVDLIVVLGLNLGKRWGLSRDLQERLKKACQLYHEGTARHIAVCGKWTVWYDWMRIKPPVTEAQRMKAYLVRRGVPAKAIISEQTSEDTIGNVYYLKLKLKHHHPQFNKLLVICAEPHQKRVRFLFDKIFGDKYDVRLLPMAAPHFKRNVTGNEERILQEQTDFLAFVRPGHEEDLKHHLYNAKYYRKQAARVEKQIKREVKTPLPRVLNKKG